MAEGEWAAGVSSLLACLLAGCEPLLGLWWWSFFVSLLGLGPGVFSAVWLAGWCFFLKKNRNDRTGKGSGRRWGAGFGWGLVWGFVLAWAFSSGIFGSGVSVGKFSLVWVIWAGEWLL